MTSLSLCLCVKTWSFKVIALKFFQLASQFFEQLCNRYGEAFCSSFNNPLGAIAKRFNHKRSEECGGKFKLFLLSTLVNFFLIHVRVKICFFLFVMKLNSMQFDYLVFHWSLHHVAANYNLSNLLNNFLFCFLVIKLSVSLRNSHFSSRAPDEYWRKSDEEENFCFTLSTALNCNLPFRFRFEIIYCLMVLRVCNRNIAFRVFNTTLNNN